jgi:hypothetical protein
MLNIQALVQFTSTLYSGEELIKNATNLTEAICQTFTDIWQELMANTSGSTYSQIVLSAMVIINFSYLFLLGFRIARQFNRQNKKVQKQELE